MEAIADQRDEGQAVERLIRSRWVQFAPSHPFLGSLPAAPFLFSLLLEESDHSGDRKNRVRAEIQDTNMGIPQIYSTDEYSEKIEKKIKIKIK